MGGPEAEGRVEVEAFVGAVGGEGRFFCHDISNEEVEVGGVEMLFAFVEEFLEEHLFFGLGFADLHVVVFLLSLLRVFHFNLIIHLQIIKLSLYYLSHHARVQNGWQVHLNRNLPQRLRPTTFLQLVLLQLRPRLLPLRHPNRLCLIHLWRTSRT